MRWLKVLGWLLVIGSIGLAVALGTGAAKESEIVEVSFYLVLAFGFGVGLLIAVPIARRSSPRGAISAILFIGAVGAAVAAFARWYFFKHFW